MELCSQLARRLRRRRRAAEGAAGTDERRPDAHGEALREEEHRAAQAGHQQDPAEAGGCPCGLPASARCGSRSVPGEHPCAGARGGDGVAGTQACLRLPQARFVLPQSCLRLRVQIRLGRRSHLSLSVVCSFTGLTGKVKRWEYIPGKLNETCFSPRRNRGREGVTLAKIAKLKLSLMLPQRASLAGSIYMQGPETLASRCWEPRLDTGSQAVTSGSSSFVMSCPRRPGHQW